MKNFRHFRKGPIFLTSVFTVIGFFAVIQLGQGYSYSEYLLRSLDGTIEYNNNELTDYIKNEILDPPSSNDYNLNFKVTMIPFTRPDGRQSFKRIQSSLFYDAAMKYLFTNKRGGWFIEAGALDGEAQSNTLYLEKELGWTGLLVEADERNYNLLLQKHRKAWAANVCLATHPYPSTELFILRSFSSAGMNTLASHDKREHITETSSGGSAFTSTQCLPLSSLLAALKVHHIDLFSLDVEGAELDILKTLDFRLFTFDVIFLELLSNRTLEDLHKEVVPLMESRGFRLFLSLDIDFIFIRKDTTYHKIALERGPVIYDVNTDTIIDKTKADDMNTS